MKSEKMSVVEAHSWNYCVFKALNPLLEALLFFKIYFYFIILFFVKFWGDLKTED